jgi:hypothetical protein
VRGATDKNSEKKNEKSEKAKIETKKKKED